MNCPVKFKTYPYQAKFSIKWLIIDYRYRIINRSDQNFPEAYINEWFTVNQSYLPISIPPYADFCTDLIPADTLMAEPAFPNIKISATYFGGAQVLQADKVIPISNMVQVDQIIFF